jgi:predicted SprT family Zn-dependent metalloprotease
MELREAQHLAITLIVEHCPDWVFGWDNARRRMGCAHFGPNKITLSRSLVAAATVDQVRETILHEIAHVLVGLKAGHGPAWYAKARALGSSGKTTHSVQTDEIAPFMCKCSCGKVYKWYKRSKNMNNKVCRTCRAKIVWMTGPQYSRLERVS